MAAAAIESTYGPRSGNRERVGRALRSDLEGLHRARRGSDRIIYQIDAHVTVIAIEHRPGVYR